MKIQAFCFYSASCEKISPYILLLLFLLFESFFNHSNFQSQLSLYYTRICRVVILDIKRSVSHFSLSTAKRNFRLHEFWPIADLQNLMEGIPTYYSIVTKYWPLWWRNIGENPRAKVKRLTHALRKKIATLTHFAYFLKHLYDILNAPIFCIYNIFSSE